MSFFKKHSKIIICLIFVLLVFAFVFLPVYTQPYYAIVHEIDHGVILSGDRINNIKGGWKSITLVDGRKEAVLSTFDITKPVYTLVTQHDLASNNISFQVIELDRVGIIDFKVVTYTDGFSDKYTFEEMIDIAKKHNLSKDNPDLNNITVRQPPTQEEIEKKRKVQQQNQAAADAVPQDIKEKMNSLTPAERELFVNFSADNYNKRIKITDDMLREFFKSIGK